MTTIFVVLIYGHFDIQCVQNCQNLNKNIQTDIPKCLKNLKIGKMHLKNLYFHRFCPLGCNFTWSTTMHMQFFHILFTNHKNAFNKSRPKSWKKEKVSLWGANSIFSRKGCTSKKGHFVCGICYGHHENWHVWH
jgi:hypothetical protein